jgi:hypothetical protein
MNTPLFLAPTQDSVIPEGLIVPQASGDLIVSTARLLHERKNDMTTEDIADVLGKSVRSARYALQAASAMGAVRLRMMPSPRRLVATTAYQQQNAFSVANETVNNIKRFPFVTAFAAYGPSVIERTIRSRGFHGQTVSRRVRAIGALSEYAFDYSPETIMPYVDEETTTKIQDVFNQRPVRKGQWSDSGRPSSRLASDTFEIPVVRASDRTSVAYSGISIIDDKFTGTSLAELSKNVCGDCFMMRSATGACMC